MNVKKLTLRTLKYIFYAVTLVQMTFGMIWMVKQFPHVQQWQSTLEYLEISQSFVLDEYVGFLYPAFLRLFLELEKLTGLPFFMAVYVVQLGLAIWTDRLFAGRILQLDKKDAAWVTGYLVTFPMLLQFHMSVRPESLALSEVLGIWILLKQEKAAGEKRFWRARGIACALTAMLIWLMPDMAVICITLWAAGFLKQMRNAHKEQQQKKGFAIRELGIRFLAFFLALLLGLGVNSMTQVPGSRGRIQKTFWAAAFQRVVTEYFSKSYAIWDEKVRTTFTIEEAMEQAKRSDNMMYVVGPELEAAWGKEAANQSYRQMALDCFRVRTKDVVYQIRDDLTDSILMPFSVWWQEGGTRRSQTGWNYSRFREWNPEISRIYWCFSLIALTILLVLRVVKAVLVRQNPLKGIAALGILACIQAMYAVWTTGNAVDYGKLLIVIAFWCMFSCGGLTKKTECNVDL